MRARTSPRQLPDDLQDEEGAQEQWEKALALNPKDPARTIISPIYTLMAAR